MLNRTSLDGEMARLHLSSEKGHRQRTDQSTEESLLERGQLANQDEKDGHATTFEEDDSEHEDGEDANVALEESLTEKGGQACTRHGAPCRRRRIDMCLPQNCAGVPSPIYRPRSATYHCTQCRDQ